MDSFTMTQITHKPERQAFIVSMPDPEEDDQGAEALLEYTLGDNGVIDFRRTYVPVAFRGKGLAEELVQDGLAWARGQGYSITASCSYVQNFISRE
jgi:predicted GNAT family acetyltransferase